MLALLVQAQSTAYSNYGPGYVDQYKNIQSSRALIKLFVRCETHQKQFATSNMLQMYRSHQLTSPIITISPTRRTNRHVYPERPITLRQETTARKLQRRKRLLQVLWRPSTAYTQAVPTLSREAQCNFQRTLPYELFLIFLAAFLKRARPIWFSRSVYFWTFLSRF